MTARYVEHRPPADLEPWVACFWHMMGDVGPGRPITHRILPDGCADIVFDLTQVRQAARRSGDVVGPMSHAVVLAIHGRIDSLGVRFRPGAIASFTGIPAVHLRDSQVADAGSTRALRVSATQLAHATGHERLTLLIDACRVQVAALARPDPLVCRAISLWSGTSSTYRHVADVARDVALSERAFERRFVNEVGLTPVHYRRVARFRSLLRLHGAGLQDWATLAAAAGFSDQAHLTRDFRAFAGQTPSDWARVQHANAGFIQDSQVTTA